MSRSGTAAEATAAAPEGTPSQAEAALARATMRTVTLRLLPFLFLLFVCNYIDRTNVAIAALQMNRDLRFSGAAYGLGSGTFFFIGYALFEVPSNLMLARFGARRWLARIVITWGLIASAMMLVRTPGQFYLLRFLLGLAEAGFWPGMVYYLSLWFPAAARARAVSRILIAVPLAAVIGNPLGGWLLGFNGTLGLRGWQWVFLFEGIPSVVLGVLALRLLTDRIEYARWLSGEQKAWLAGHLRREQEQQAAPHVSPLLALAHPIVWLASALYFLNMMGVYGYLFWAPIVVRDVLRATPLATGLITGGMGCAAALALLAIGASSDHSGDRFGHMIGLALLAASAYLGAALLGSPAARVACLALVFIGAQGFCIPFWCLPSRLLRGSAAAAAIAFINSFGNLGGAVAPYVIGRVRDATGSPSGAFVMLAGVGVGVAALSLVLRSRPAFAPRLVAGGVPALGVASGD